MNQAVMTAIANEARRGELKQKLAALQAEISCTGNIAALMSQTNQDAQRRYTNAAAELTALEAGAGPGVTDDFGDRVTIITAFIAKAQEAGLILAETVDAFKTLI